MAFVLNTSARAIYTQLCSKGSGEMLNINKRFTFNPGELTQVDDGDWKDLKEQKFIQECLDNEVLEVGSRAKKKGAKASAEIKDVDDKAKDLGKKEDDN